MYLEEHSIKMNYAHIDIMDNIICQCGTSIVNYENIYNHICEINLNVWY